MSSTAILTLPRFCQARVTDVDREISVHIDPRVFPSRPQDLSLEGGVSLADALGDAAVGADRIIILSAYYGTRYLESALATFSRKDRRACSLTMVFGVETASKLPHAVEELRKLQTYPPDWPKTARSDTDS
jgi:hypothetical protein